MDARVEELVAAFDKASLQIADAVAEMSEAEGPRRRELYLLIIGILASLRILAADWGRRVLAEVYSEADAKAIADLEMMGLGGFKDVLPDITPALEETVLGLEADIGKAITSIQATASRARSGIGVKELVALLAGSSILMSGAKASRAQLRDVIRQKLVSVIGKDGKAYGFSLSEYVGIVATAKVADVITFATSVRATAENFDLLQVSPQPSTIGDYCDEYRGKVVSRSGKHPQYPPMSVLPNGGAPFHPRCHHVMQIFTGQDDTGSIGEAFLELGQTPGVSANDLQSLWLALRK